MSTKTKQNECIAHDDVNPLGLNLGQRIKIKAFIEVESKASIIRTKCSKYCFVTGVATIKQTVCQHVDKKLGEADLFYDLTTSLILYKCKDRLNQRSFLVSPSDILVLDEDQMPKTTP